MNEHDFKAEKAGAWLPCQVCGKLTAIPSGVCCWCRMERSGDDFDFVAELYKEVAKRGQKDRGEKAGSNS